MKRYSLWGLLRTDFMRSVSMTRLKLRERREIAQNNTSIPSSYMASVPLATLGTLALLVGLLFGPPVLLVTGCALLSGTIVLNRAFLATIQASEGWGRALGAILLLWLELLVVGVGVGVGMLSFPFGQRY